MNVKRSRELQCKLYLSQFILPNLGEHRGIGGIFYDDLAEPDLESCLKFASSSCAAIMPAYTPIVEKQMGKAFSEKEKEWQEFRRGRLVKKS